MPQVFLFLLHGIPEITGLLACSLALARVDFRWGIIIAAACVFAAIIYLVRSLPLTFGLHTVIAILLYALFIAKATRVPPSTSFMVVFATMTFLFLVEVPMSVLYVALLETGISKFLTAEVIWHLAGLPQAILLITGALFISKHRKPLQDMWRI